MQLFSLLLIIWTHKPLLVCVDACQIHSQPCFMPCCSGSRCCLPAAPEQAQRAASPRCRPRPSPSLGRGLVSLGLVPLHSSYYQDTSSRQAQESTERWFRPGDEVAGSSAGFAAQIYSELLGALPSLVCVSVWLSFSLFRDFQEFLSFSAPFRLGFGQSAWITCSDATPGLIILGSSENPGSHRSRWSCGPAWAHICFH